MKLTRAGKAIGIGRGAQHLSAWRSRPVMHRSSLAPDSLKDGEE
jgi:hypothetical protein